MTRKELIEVMASTAAESLNGGSWSDPTFYVEIHKQSWRKAAERMLSAIEASGHVVVPREATVEMEVAGTEAWLCEAAMEDRSAVNYRAMIEAGKV